MAGELSTKPEATDRERWLELISRLDVEVLLVDFMERLGEMPEYRDGKVSIVERSQNSREAFTEIIAQMRGEGDDESFRRAGFSLGVARAHSGISRATLSTVINTDYLVIWNGLVSVADPEDAPLLLRHADLVWGIVEEYGRAAQDGYLAELELIADERQFRERTLLVELIDHDSVSDSRSREIAEVLGLPVDDGFVILAAVGVEAVELRKDLNPKTRVDGTVSFFYRERTLMLIASRSAWRTSPALRQVRAAGYGAIVFVDRFNDVRTGARLAHGLAQLPSRSDRQRRSLDDWPQLVKQELQKSHLSAVVEIEAGLDACSETERELLERSIRAYLEAGSVREASEQLFCHRNTLTNRMRRFAELTGLDVTVPVQAARVVLAWA